MMVVGLAWDLTDPGVAWPLSTPFFQGLLLVATCGEQLTTSLSPSSLVGRRGSSMSTEGNRAG